MRVVIAAGTMLAEPYGVPVAQDDSSVLHAGEVGQALARGWRQARPDDDVVVLPMPDGGPGSVSALLTAQKLSGQQPIVQLLTAPDALGQMRDISLLCLEPDKTSSQRTWFLDAGALLAVPADRARAAQEAISGTTEGLGILLRQALAAVPQEDLLMISLGRSAVHDGGAGMMRALGGAAAAYELLHHRRVRLLLSDYTPLGGLNGAGAQLAQVVGISSEQAQALDRAACAANSHYLNEIETHRQKSNRLTLIASTSADGQQPERLSSSSTWGGGAAGGAALLLQSLVMLTNSAVDVLADFLGLAQLLAGADLAVTTAGEVFDVLEHTVLSTVGCQAQEQAIPAVLVAGRCAASSGELAEAGIVSAYSLSDRWQDARLDALSWNQASFTAIVEQLAQRGARLARTWSR